MYIIYILYLSICLSLTHTYAHTLLRNGLEETSEALVALSESEGQQHDVRGGHERDWNSHCFTKPAEKRKDTHCAHAYCTSR